MNYLSRALEAINSIEAKIARWMEKMDYQECEEWRRYYDLLDDKKNCPPDDLAAQEARVKAAMRVPNPTPLIHPVHLTSQLPFLFGSGVAWVGTEGPGGDIHVHYRDGRKCIYIATEVAHGT